MIQEKIDPITLSQAMRKGAKLHPQSYHDIFGYDSSTGECTASSAIGAAIIGKVGIANKMRYDSDVVFPETRYDCRTCPACGEKWPYKDQYTIKANIGHLNNDHRWTRESIADWLESIGL